MSRREAARRAHRRCGEMASGGKKGYLETQAVGAKTRLSSSPILCEFYRFAAELPPIHTDGDLDERLVDYADHCYFEGIPGAYGQKV